MKKTRIRFINIILLIILLLSFSACGKGNETGINEKQSYNVSNEYFTIATYKPHTYTTVNLKSGTRTYEYVLKCTSSCEVSLYEYEATAKLFSSNQLLDSKIIKKTNDIKAKTEFSFEIVVSQDVQLKTDSIDVLFSGKSYDEPGPITKKYQVTFVYNNGLANSKTMVEEGKTIATPEDPIKTNYVFCGWYTESSLINKYDFSKLIRKNLTLYAKYEIDATKLTNKISTDLIKGVVKIYNKSYNSFLGIETASSTSQGSGFCFASGNGAYWILTNCHVAKKNSDYKKQEIIIEDYQGRTYEAKIYKNPNKSMSAIDASYDLACLYFEASSTNIKKLQIVKENPSINEDVISIGAPEGQSNSITYGNIGGYEKITLSNTSTSLSNVKFEVIRHNAYANSGSSGGPLLNADLNVVGVHYAGSKSTNREYAIPARKIHEFLNTYVYN